MSEENRSLQDKFMLRLPDGMRDRLKAVAAANNRSLNAEIIARLEQTFEPSPQYTTIGMGALAGRLEANAEVTEQLAFKLLYELRSAAGYVSDDDQAVSEAVARYAEATGLNKGQAVHRILQGWLIDHGLLAPQPVKPSRG